MKGNKRERQKFVKKFCRALEVYWCGRDMLRWTQISILLNDTLKGYSGFDDTFYCEDEYVYRMLDIIINTKKD